MERCEQAFLEGFGAGLEKQAKVNILARLFGKKTPAPTPLTKTEKIKAFAKKLEGPARGFGRGFVRGAIPGFAIGSAISLGRTFGKEKKKKEKPEGEKKE